MKLEKFIQLMISYKKKFFLKNISLKIRIKKPSKKTHEIKKIRKYNQSNLRNLMTWFKDTHK